MDNHQLIDLLQQQAVEIARDGHAGWGNTMTLAAERVRELEAECARLREGATVEAELVRTLELAEAHLEEMRQDARLHPIMHCPVLDRVRQTLAQHRERKAQTEPDHRLVKAAQLLEQSAAPFDQACALIREVAGHAPQEAK